MTSVESRFDPHSNALNLIRLALACLVIVSHSFPVGRVGPEPVIGDVTLGVLAVGGFFVISGYLITRSREASKLLPFLWRRALRILPGVWLCLAVTGFVFAALAGLVRGGWSPELAFHYFISNARFHDGDGTVGQTLAGAAFPSGWNGSLWTLQYEMACYVLIGVAYLFGFVRRNRWMMLAAFAATSVLSVTAINVLHMSGPVYKMLLLLPFFLAGAALFRFADRVPSDWRIGLGCLLLVIVLSLSGFGRTLTAAPMAYLMLWLGSTAPGWMRRAGSKNDYSYGAYVYGMPVQQVLVLIGANTLGAPFFVAASLIATAPFAAMSWFAVERPALRLKNAVGSRSRERKIEARVSG